MAVITYREALNQALAEEMERDPDVFLMGEEVGVYNGAYKVSKGLLDRFVRIRRVVGGRGRGLRHEAHGGSGDDRGNDRRRNTHTA